MDDEETVRINVEVPESVRDTAKQKLDYGGLSREIRERLEEIAFGPELAHRSRLERQRADLKNRLRDVREKRREIDAEIETLEEQVQAVDEKLGSITEREDKYDAKLEELESQLRRDGMRLDVENPKVGRAAATGGVEPEGVIRELKDRNPDVPDYAFEDGLHDHEHDWTGVLDEDLGQDPDEREARYR
ncbi:hypothetical protein [Halococcus saccharolyticus]|uniref:Uncharacterized protein n=1 Tax=Halococcus saccharolyticus DSM 5350 TaxID=1227455 RepID=M0MBF2_9EURY|nr:hypothetical protein [Halococcus saccharolyticus]EMA42678.1 hypothetical protein C449_16088 [Halococcus saccharolyticus DSM 5350]